MLCLCRPRVRDLLLPRFAFAEAIGGRRVLEPPRIAFRVFPFFQASRPWSVFRSSRPFQPWGSCSCGFSGAGDSCAASAAFLLAAASGFFPSAGFISGRFRPSAVLASAVLPSAVLASSAVGLAGGGRPSAFFFRGAGLAGGGGFGFFFAADQRRGGGAPAAALVGRDRRRFGARLTTLREPLRSLGVDGQEDLANLGRERIGQVIGAELVQQGAELHALALGDGPFHARHFAGGRFLVGHQVQNAQRGHRARIDRNTMTAQRGLDHVGHDEPASCRPSSPAT